MRGRGEAQRLEMKTLLTSEVESQVHLEFAADGLRCTIRAPFGEKLDALQLDGGTGEKKGDLSNGGR